MLRGGGPHRPLSEMRDAAKKSLMQLGFPECHLLELYWLCCVFADYETEYGFKFDKLILPSWFPLPFGFRDEEFINPEFLNLRGGRIKPPDVWSEADRLFHFKKEPIRYYDSQEEETAAFERYPERDFTLVLPSDHPVRQFVSKGRPTTVPPDGVEYLA